MSNIERVPVGALKPYARNARTHSKKQIEQIARSIERFGFTNPVLVGDDLTIIAGHGRVEAAKHLEMTDVPVLRLSHLTEAERRAYVIADNRLAELAGWDREILAIELEGPVELDFEVELVGFETTEVDLILDERRDADPTSANDPDDEDVPTAPQNPVTMLCSALHDVAPSCWASADAASVPPTASTKASENGMEADTPVVVATPRSTT